MAAPLPYEQTLKQNARECIPARFFFQIADDYFSTPP